MGEEIHLQYYWDGGCSNFSAEYYVLDSSCHPWYISNTWSANIATCVTNYNECGCWFYYLDNCTGGFVYLRVENGVHGNCANNDGVGYKSVLCDLRGADALYLVLSLSYSPI